MNTTEIARKVMDKCQSRNMLLLVYEFMVEFVVEHTYPPILAEIAEAINVFGDKETASLSTASRYLKRLSEAGLIDIPTEPDRRRRIEGRIAISGIEVNRLEETAE